MLFKFINKNGRYLLHFRESPTVFKIYVNIVIWKVLGTYTLLLGDCGIAGTDPEITQGGWLA